MACGGELAYGLSASVVVAAPEKGLRVNRKRVLRVMRGGWCAHVGVHAGRKRGAAGRPISPGGNSYIEGFYRSLKEEEVWAAEYRTLEEARASIAC
jgi:hypothetical protein